MLLPSMRLARAEAAARSRSATAPAPTITLDSHVAAVPGSPAACRNVLRQLRVRAEDGTWTRRSGAA